MTDAVFEMKDGSPRCLHEFIIVNSYGFFQCEKKRGHEGKHELTLKW